MRAEGKNMVPRDGTTPFKNLGYKPISMRVTGYKSTLLKSFCPRSRPKYNLWTVLWGEGAIAFIR